jgi:hypothetical protein
MQVSHISSFTILVMLVEWLGFSAAWVGLLGLFLSIRKEPHVDTASMGKGEVKRFGKHKPEWLRWDEWKKNDMYCSPHQNQDRVLFLI